MSILPQAHPFKGIVQYLGDALFPGSCLLCGGDSNGAVICAPCAAELPALPETRCPLCADSTPFAEPCGACLKSPPHFDHTEALFRYAFPADRLIHALKYGHQLALAPWLGAQLAKLIQADAVDLMMPLPLHPSRLKERGFNQAQEIARQIAKWQKIPVDRSSLIRSRATDPQARLSLNKRQQNVRGAFECRADFSGKRIVLIDDVMTTGASANECARVLKLHGARHVTLVVAARAYLD